MNILLVEDDTGLSSSIREFLVGQGYVCETTAQYSDADLKARLYQYDCFVVDITLPDGNGLDIVQTLKRNESPAGILIISARDSLNDKVKGLELGADDYLTKPFHLAELNARIKAILRRRFQGGFDRIEEGVLTIIPDTREVLVAEESISLTPKEFDLLLFLVNNQGHVLSKETIAEHLWGSFMDQADSFEFIYYHIKNIRKKLNNSQAGNYIQTVYGVGYTFRIS